MDVLLYPSISVTVASGGHKYPQLLELQDNAGTAVLRVSSGPGTFDGSAIMFPDDAAFLAFAEQVSELRQRLVEKTN